MEEDPDVFFDVVATSEETEVAIASVVPLPQAIDEEVSRWNDGGANDLLNSLNGVVDIDDDNEPAPENIPSPQDDASLTDFRKPLQVQSHLEMPRILVQLGHIQRT